MYGIELTECVGFQSTSCPASAQVKRSGAVSPAARAIASVVPGEDAAERGREHDAEHGLPLRDAERVARLAQARSATSVSTSIVARATSGSMMIASAKPPAIALWWWPQPTTGRLTLTQSAKTKMPITIDGKPFSTSSQRRTCSADPLRCELADVDRRQHADRQRHRRRDPDEEQTADERRRDAAARLAEERRPLREEVQVSACTPRENTDQTRIPSTAIAARGGAERREPPRCG